MALAISIILFLAVTGSITLFGYRRYVLIGRVYENVQPEPSDWEVSPQQTSSRFMDFVKFAERMGRKVPPSPKNASRFRENLVACGYRSQNAVAIFYGFKLMLAVGLLLLVTLIEFSSSYSGTARVMAMLVALVVGFRVPDLVVKRRANRRQDRLRKALPDALDLMVVCTEAGLALDRSFRSVTQQLGSAYAELSDEFGLVTAEITAGVRRKEALDNLATRTREPEIRKFVAVLTQADRFGTSMGDAMRTHAEYLRIRRKQEAEERAAKVGIKLIFPIFFFILPCMFLVTIGPAAIQLSKHLGSALGGTP